MPTNRMTSAEREFFAALADVVFGNPFSAQRSVAIVRLAPGAKLGDLIEDREALARVVAPRLEPFLREGAEGLRRFDADDRRLIEPALLYVGYHRCVPQLDALIERQASHGGEPLAGPFGEEAVAALGGSGAAPGKAPR